jgi:hypothetical protein
MAELMLTTYLISIPNQGVIYLILQIKKVVSRIWMEEVGFLKKSPVLQEGESGEPGK